MRFATVPARKPPERIRGVALQRSLPDPKSLALILVGASAAIGWLGCSRMPGEPDPYPAAWNADDIALGRCVQTCSPDYGPQPITLEECNRQEEGLEFFPVAVWDWEPVPPPPPGMNRPPTYDPINAYAYQDNTTEFLATDNLTLADKPLCTVEEHAREPRDTNCMSSYSHQRGTGGPALTSPIDRCGSTRALHVRGGPFREWGGGIGVRLDNLAVTAARKLRGSCTIPPPEEPDPSAPAFCPEFDPFVADAPGVYLPPANGQPEGMQTFNAQNYYAMQVDLREWDGISFWARRGPDSQAGFRIGLGDRNLDDDASMLATAGGIANPRCQRSKECDCRNHRPCNQGPDGGFYCWDPKLDSHPDDQWNPWNHDPARCRDTQCNDPYAAYEAIPDLPFITADRDDRYSVIATATCNTYTFRNDITRDNCFDKNGSPPPEGFQKCGDPWFAPVRLSTDWGFYRIPFTELRQEGYGKEFPALERAAVTMVRVTWTVGWVDYWIDDVRFYRKK
jgi:hypothetical protein